eukprot:TRINITY_DN26985_c0_g1_i1.p1 TRINITY_DN26985_c0_g1~~TRINITY_DN26985_c0_g1_i1.p1  ORF type:complete len:779 (-),score=124.95 TRINITY_DN26985_c0_g1_i1:42-2093(-)
MAVVPISKENVDVRRLDDGEIEQEYELEVSMWDCSVLLFTGSVSTWNSMILVVGLLLNIVLQTLFLIVIVTTMLEADINESTVKSKLLWRVSDGHSSRNIDEASGSSKVEQLCAQSLWSFEQSEYNSMVGHTKSGTYLASIALIIWILFTISELRCSVDQLCAIVSLPILRTGPALIPAEDEDDKVDIVGISRIGKVLALVMVVIPRIVLISILSICGCKYLSQTLSLSDIVLNACGLTFVTDIDELVAQVLLSKTMMSKMESIRPVKYGKARTFLGGPALKDLFRYALAAGIMVFATMYFLMPFASNVSAASQALCGGVQDFSFSGGTTLDSQVVIRGTQVAGECSGVDGSAYFTDHYFGHGARKNISAKPRASKKASISRMAETQTRLVLRHIYNDPCSKKSTSLSTVKYDSVCASMSPPLKAVLDRLNVSASGTPKDYPQCPRINLSNPFACNLPVRNLSACVWSHFADECEGKPPGVRTSTCSDDIWEQCQKYNELGMTHPSKNCAFLYMCPRDPCLSMIGTVNVRCQANLTNIDSGFFLRERKSFMIASAGDAIAKAFNASLATWEAKSVHVTKLDMSFIDANVSSAAAATAEITFEYDIMPVPLEVLDDTTNSSVFKTKVQRRLNFLFTKNRTGLKVRKVLNSTSQFLKTEDLVLRRNPPEPEESMDDYVSFDGSYA